MFELAFLVASALGGALAVSDDRLTRMNRSMSLSDFEEANLAARCLTAWLGEEAGWTALQCCGILLLAAMLLIAFLYPLMAWAVAGVFASGLALVLFDLFHDAKEMRSRGPAAAGCRSGARRSEPPLDRRAGSPRARGPGART